jgi:L-alanine-DL-glutamate epimerase-like enolase superfamily enzyme
VRGWRLVGERRDAVVTLDPIARVEGVAVTVPLPVPIRLGRVELREREYALARVTTAAGLVGSAYCLTRCAPIVEALDRLVAPSLVGEDSDAVEARWEQGYRATIMPGRSGVVTRALGLVDIALWDIKAKRAAMPLWRLLGGHEPSVPALLIAGYPVTGGSMEQLANDLVAYAERGHRLIKVARIADRDVMRTLLSDLAARFERKAGIVVDAAYCWSTVTEACEEIGGWDARLTWLEDPFPPERVRAYAQFRGRCPHPLAAGDESSDSATGALLDAGLLDYLRLDIPAVGGITPALRLMGRAAAAEIPVSFHIYPEISVHLAAARAQETIVETFDTTLPGGNPFDPAHTLTGMQFAARDGRITAPERPGLGISLDWPATS